MALFHSQARRDMRNIFLPPSSENSFELMIDGFHTVFFFSNICILKTKVLLAQYTYLGLKLKTKKTRCMPLWLDRAGKIDGLPGASLVEIFVIYSMESVLHAWIQEF